VTSWSATSITATVPSGAVAGNNTVNIVTSAGVTSNTEIRSRLTRAARPQGIGLPIRSIRVGPCLLPRPP
jgi:hypothetical protein